ncbi:MAG: radical SAM protein [Aquificae bacterium]|nr:radical SAM protein [Aquificota bacterium]
MLRITQLAKSALKKRVTPPFGGVILIWNLTNRCNLYCKHCYAWANREREELTLDEIKALIPQLKNEGVKFVILSGGEPLQREDLFEVAKLLKEAGFKTSLSTNGLLINRDNLPLIKSCFDYVGVSVDGRPETHDRFRGKDGAFKGAVKALELCLEEGIPAGLRFTLTKATEQDLPYAFELARSLGVPKLYISHLVYAGRGTRLTGPEKRRYRSLVEFIVNKSFELLDELTVVTGNNEADAAVLYELFKRRYPEHAPYLYESLLNWGGNQAGVRLVNINHKGEVRPDPFFFHSLGSVRERSFSEIWRGNGLLTRLRERPRRVKGKCESCAYLPVCNGNSRARAYYATGDYFGEDPACYL